jgi:GT2 family glycosyltransferase
VFILKVYIIIINWNGWQDTIECLESIFRLKYKNFQVIVCDNNSEDNSLDYIKKWAAGNLDVFVPEQTPLHHLTHPPCKKPISYAHFERISLGFREISFNNSPDIILIQSKKNLGFAGGNNIGIRYALDRGDFQYIWLLNNDTVIDPNALSELISRFEKDSATGSCGSTLLYYHDPYKIQALSGGIYNKWFAITKHIGSMQNISKPIISNIVEKQLSYIVGASLLISKNFIERVGLMSESYFIYFEELDWFTRAKDHFTMAYAKDSIVYHKEGRSTGSLIDKSRNSYLSDYYSIKNRIVFSRKFYPYALPFIYLSLIIAIINRIKRNQWDRVLMIIKIGCGLD